MDREVDNLGGYYNEVLIDPTVVGISQAVIFTPWWSYISSL